MWMGYVQGMVERSVTNFGGVPVILDVANKPESIRGAIEFARSMMKGRCV